MNLLANSKLAAECGGRYGTDRPYWVSCRTRFEGSLSAVIAPKAFLQFAVHPSRFGDTENSTVRQTRRFPAH